jgi:hypothetical protein
MGIFLRGGAGVGGAVDDRRRLGPQEGGGPKCLISLALPLARRHLNVLLR